MDKTLSTLFIAHRGESFNAPENTLAAINLAWQNNADGVEIDIQLSKDKEIVVIHDKTTRRTAGALKYVKSQPLEILRNLDVGKFKGNQWSNEKIPTLKEVLSTVPDKKYIFIEIKCGAEIIGPLQKVFAATHLKKSQIILMGFDLSTIKKVKKSFSEYKTYWIRRSNPTKINFNRFTLDKIIDTVIKNNLDGINFSYSKKFTQDFVKKIKSKDLSVCVWTVNSIDKASKLIDFGIDGIISDRQFYLRKNLYL